MTDSKKGISDPPGGPSTFASMSFAASVVSEKLQALFWPTGAVQDHVQETLETGRTRSHDQQLHSLDLKLHSSRISSQDCSRCQHCS